MRDQLLKHLESEILTRFPAGKSYSRAQIESSEIPNGVKHFLLSALQRRSELEASQLLNVRSEWFDADDDMYQKVLQHAVLTLGSAARFPVSEWQRAVHQAVEHVLDYLVTPTSLLVKFIFGTDSDSCSATDVQRKTGYFVDYTYITRAVDAYISKKKNQRIFKTDFASALIHIDRQLTNSYSPEEWVRLLGPLAGLIQLPNPGIPVPLVLQFFQEKGQENYCKVIHRAAVAKQAELVSMRSLQSLLESANEPEPEAAPAAPPPPVPKAPVAPAATPVPAIPATPPAPASPATPATPIAPAIPATPAASATPPAPASPAAPEAPMPLWKKFQKNVGDSASNPVAPPSSGEPIAAQPEPLWKTFKKNRNEPSFVAPTQELPLADTPQPDFTAIVLGKAASRKDLFLRELFKGDAEAFETTLQALAAAPDWTVASEIIAQRVFRPFKVDIYSNSAVDFTNAVESRYSGLTT